MTRLLPLLILVAIAASCAVKTDLGKPCFLVKKDPTDPSGQRSINIKESEITPGKDFISFGAVDCENLVCVRDGSPESNPPNSNPAADAMGYCSNYCEPAISGTCAHLFVAEDETNAARMLACRALLLDEATLAAICQSDPATCKKYFGDTKKPYFCARNMVADAGT